MAARHASLGRLMNATAPTRPRRTREHLDAPFFENYFAKYGHCRSKHTSAGHQWCFAQQVPRIDLPEDTDTYDQTQGCKGAWTHAGKLKSSSHFLLLHLFDPIRFAQTLLESLGVGVLG